MSEITKERLDEWEATAIQRAKPGSSLRGMAAEIVVSLIPLARDGLAARDVCHHSDAYWSNEHDNYYCGKCNKGMGQAYCNVAKQRDDLKRQLAESQSARAALRAELTRLRDTVAEPDQESIDRVLKGEK